MQSSRLKAHLAVIAILCIAPTLPADEIQFADGREFVGEILERNEGSIVLRTLVASRPVTLRLEFGENDRVREKKLPKDFFSPRKKVIPAPEGSPPDGADRQYLEIPIRGRIGDGCRRLVAVVGRERGKPHERRENDKCC